MKYEDFSRIMIKISFKKKKYHSRLNYAQMEILLKKLNHSICNNLINKIERIISKLVGKKWEKASIKYKSFIPLSSVFPRRKKKKRKILCILANLSSRNSISLILPDQLTIN